MLDISQPSLRQTAINFLLAPPEERLLTLEKLGIARYHFLTKLQLQEGNINCVMRFLENPERVKFPMLKNADLSGLILDDSNFIRGNFTEANLQGCSLINADLIFANFTGADLRQANLTGATLNESIWHQTLVIDCCLGQGIGLTVWQRKDLQNRGARFITSSDDG
ncbi:pentapeptide repeat-containing protein [Calothrix sp. 336/3]|uniref:pentapeptide repeat-containing protein n=1 Tax=Calothrix sp. 336/3 TaxID=1337936 RepID=UPI0004E28ECF|nr:pentapeptide repeat-containing protein [Calothrix sp. 336/3]AKG22998.1 pentapeptide repeat-containing protein [Calothrix sp. 336/3]